ncbi:MULTISPECIES: ring-cleaving dioxygenase [unclassified Paenibacillus]|uniref:ring-cleaving dioxygenase n=1 Tax=unclassified Paenibacillus TaxID=185978 RepID=UPI002F422ACB
MSTLQTAGIHHITAFVKDPQRTTDFYAGVLGLRLVKKTINFDAPEVYHLYLGDAQGSPGTIITFFPWSEGRKGRVGTGQVGITGYAVPIGALPFWENRLSKFQIPYEILERFGDKLLSFSDPDGLKIELVERDMKNDHTWEFGGITAKEAIRGFSGAVLYSHNPAKTAETLEKVLGMTKVGSSNGFTRLRAAGDIGNVIDISDQQAAVGAGGSGTVHHIAWRAKDMEEHARWREHVANQGFEPTPIVDRQYFNAIYFREHGGILFEIATDPPGFAKDEAPEHLGEQLMLPAWYEPQRAAIEQLLQPFEVRVLKEDQ